MKLSTALSAFTCVQIALVPCVVVDAFQSTRLVLLRSSAAEMGQQSPQCLLGFSALFLSANNNNLPSIVQLSKDTFMKQVEYGSVLTAQLQTFNNSDDDDSNLPPSSSNLEELLQAQLSHSDGIRGFMVSYLTAEVSPADQDDIPTPLIQALKAQFRSETARDDLVSLACMFKPAVAIAPF